MGWLYYRMETRRLSRSDKGKREMTGQSKDSGGHPSKRTKKHGGAAEEQRPRSVKRRRKTTGLRHTMERLSYGTALVMTCLMFVAVGVTWMSKPPKNGAAPQPTAVLPIQTERPVDAQIPEATQSPEEAQVPEETQAPEEVQLPDVTQAPEEAQVPEVTRSPEKTQPPEEAQATEVAREPSQPVEQTVSPEQAAAFDAFDGPVQRPLSASVHNTAVILDGKVQITGDNAFGLCDTASWPDAVCVCLGNEHALALTPSGGILCAGSNEQHQCELETDGMPIRSIAAGPYASYAVMADGTVRMCGSSVVSSQSLAQVTGAVDIAAAQTHVLILKEDGTVAAFGDKREGACDVGEWRDIVMIGCGYGYSLALDAGGQVWLAGNGDQGRGDITRVTDAVSIAAGSIACYAVRRDGTVVAAGSNGSDQLNVSDWTGVKAVAGGYLHAAALTEDGKVLIAGRDPAQ